MLRLFGFGLVILLSFGSNVNSSPTNEKYSEGAALKYINETSEEFINLYDIMAQKAFENDNQNFIDALMSIDLLEQVAMNLAEMSAYTKKFPYETYSDAEIKSGIQNLRKAAYLYVLEENYFNKFMVSTSHLQHLSTSEKVCEFNKPENCNLSFHPDIAKIIAKSSNPDELIYYWAAWRDTDRETKILHFKNFLDWFEEAANITQVSPLSLWYRNYNDETFINEMEKVMGELLPFYQQLHAYIRYSLVKKLGMSSVTPEGLIPYHLVEQVLAQNWKNTNNVEIPYPEDQLVQLDEKIAEKDFDAKKFVDISNDFYKSLGFEELPDKFWSSSFKSFAADTAKSNCRAEIFDSTPSPYLKYCPQTDFRKFLQIHSWMAPIHYANQKKDLPFAHFQSYKFASPVGEAVLLSASTPKYLDQMDIIPNSEYTEKQFINRLFKMAVHTIFNVPMFFVHSKVINDLLSGEVAFRDFNRYYWHLMGKFAGIAPPIQRFEDSIDFPDKFYEDLENNFHTNKFVSEIVGYQLYKGLCEKSGQYSETDPNLPLHNCNFYGSRGAGSALKEMMKLGSKKSWREVLKVVTGDDNGMCAQSMLKYYQPLLKWLGEALYDKNIIAGW